MNSRQAVTALAFLAVTSCGGGTDAPSVASVVITTPDDSLLVRQTMHLAATVLDRNGGTIAGQGITWRSSSNSIATVSPSGLVTGVGEGDVTISATAGGKSGAAPIAVHFRFPAVAGTYRVAGSFAADPSRFTFTGTLVLSQSDRNEEDVGGTITVTVSPGLGGTTLSAPVSSGFVEEDGGIAFSFGPYDPSVYWIFGALPNASRSAFTGVHELRGSSGVSRGTWTATRTSAAVAAAARPTRCAACVLDARLSALR